MATSTLGGNLRSAREGRGWSRETLARKSSTSVPAIARTELYGTEPRLSTLWKWALALEVEPTELLPDVQVFNLAAEIDAALDDKAAS